MKRKNVLSALLAVMMVLSMMTAINLPAVAAGEKTDLPSIQTAASTDTVTEYALSSVADLIWWGQNPTAVTVSDTVYLTNDINIAAYGATFAKDFTPIRRTYASLDGQGHTIYGYTHTNAIFADRYYGKSIKNLIIDSAYVVSAEYGVSILVKALEADCLIENVHMRNCVLVGSDSKVTGLGYGYHALFSGYMNNRRSDFDITFRNCSISGSTMDCNGWSDCGLWVGRFRSGGEIRFENCVTYDSDIINFTAGATIAPFGWMSDSREVYFDNIGAFNCQLIGAPASQSVVNASGFEFGYINNVFAAGNLTSSGNGLTYADTPIAKAATIAATVENYLVDSGTANVTNSTAAVAPMQVENLSVATALTGMNKAVDISGMGFADWGFDAYGNVILIEEGSNAQPVYEITFKDMGGNVLVSLPTNIYGYMVLDEATLAFLKSNHWKIENDTQNYLNDYAWETVDFNGNASFVAHDTTVAPHDTDAKYHTVTCSMEGCAETEAKVACTGIQQIDLYEEAGYFTPAIQHFECPVCDQTWTAEDTEAENPAMVTLNFQKDAYDAGEMIALEIGVNADTGLEGFELELTYDTDKISYIDYIVMEDGFAGDAAETVNKMKVAAYADAPATEAGKWMTVYFRAAEDLSVDALVELTSLLTVAVVNGEERTADVKNKTAADATMLYAGCNPGDVNRSGSVDLLDVVLTVDALNGSLDDVQAALFSVRAANVDGDADNTVTTNDVTYLLRNLLDWGDYATLNLAKPGTTLVELA